MKSVLKLKTLKITVIFLIVTVVLLFFSFLSAVSCNSEIMRWLSNALIGISGGIIAGYFIYYLTNIRNVEKETVAYEYDAMKKLWISIQKGKKTIRDYNSIDFNNVADDYDELINVFDTYEVVIENICNLPYSLFLTLELDKEKWLDIAEREVSNYELLSDDDDGKLYDRVQELSDILIFLDKKTKNELDELAEKKKALSKYGF